jgi:mannitol-1-phosphate 5-dehydrogenase
MEGASSARMRSPLTLGIDVGTSATKVLLLNNVGKWDMESWPTDEGVWRNLREWLGERGETVTRVGITGHGPSAIVIRDGEVVGRSIHWFDEISEGCERPVENDHILSATRAWVPSRLAQWEEENGAVGDGVAVQLKDMLNWELTGVVARDSRSMRGYSGTGNFHLPEEVIGLVSEAGSALSGISIGAEVICGCDDLSAGVLGLETGSGDLFNLANTSEHVGLVGGEPMDDLSWLPAVGRLPALCYSSTATGGGSLAASFGAPATREGVEKLISQLENEEIRGLGLFSEDGVELKSPGAAWKAIRELNYPIDEIRQRLPEGEMFIGGGLALIPQLVESRGATLRAGQEVSVLGVAKLAQHPLAVIFGAGKVGRGFLAQLLLRAGWRIHFVDSSETLVSALSGGSYTICNLGTGEVETVSEFTVSTDSWRLDEASLILTSLGANGLASWAESVADLDRSVDIILAENHPAPAALVRQHLTSLRVGVAQAQVLRSCIEPTAEQVAEFGPLTVQVQDHWTLPLDGGALVTPELVNSVSGFELRPEFSIELTRKLYTYNAINAAVCYLGAEKGYEWLAEAANDPEIAAIARQVGEESSAALVIEFGFVAAEQAAWCERALSKYQDESIRDPIERNARDPIRKLGLHDRILGPIHLCLAHSLPHSALLQTARSAIAYREPSDSAAVQLAEWLEEHGLWGMLRQVAPGINQALEGDFGSTL